MLNASKIVFIEFDGASWNVINPLLQKNKLPNIKYLIKNGASGTVLSDPPLLSPRLWVSIFSGKHSKKHGVEFFGNSSTMVKCKRIWDIFHEKGYTVGVFGSFVTWPPYPVNGFMIPSLFALGTETYPEEYKFLQELTLSERKKGKSVIPSNGNKKSLIHYAVKMKTHGVSFKTLWTAGAQIITNHLKKSSNDERYLKRTVAHLNISTEIFLHLYKRYKPFFATMHIHLCDAIAHRYWKYYEPKKFQDIDQRLAERYRNVIPNAYIEADRMIGKIVEKAGDAIIMVMSDHGSDAMETSKTAYSLHIENFLNLFKLRDKVIPANVGLMTFCYFQDKESMQEMLPLFEKVTFQGTGERVFDVLKEESLIGLRLSKDFWGKEIRGEMRLNLEKLGICNFSDLFLLQKMEVSGTHSREGILIMNGPNIKKEVHIKGATIFDITPTALALSGLPVAKDMDGKVLEDVFEDKFLTTHSVQYIDSYEDNLSPTKIALEEAKYDQIKGQLKSLGYL